jgi:hypothetical protein
MRYYKVRERIVTCVVSVDLTYKGSCGENTLEKGRSLYLDKGSNQNVSEDQSTQRTQRGASAYLPGPSPVSRSHSSRNSTHRTFGQGGGRSLEWTAAGREEVCSDVLPRTSAELRQLDNRDRKLIMNSCEHRLDEDRLPS